MRSCTLLLGSLVVSFALECAAAARVEQFSPTGTVKSPRQVAARFSEPMVRLGEPRAAAPFEIDCGAAGSGRWVDTTHWVFDFEAAVRGGVVCRFVTKPGTAAVSGASLEPATFEFDTGGPAIQATLPVEGDPSIDENAVFLIAADAPVDVESVRARARCEVEGIGEAIPVDVLEGEARVAVLRERARTGYSYASFLGRDRERIEPFTAADRERAEADVLALRCRRALPPATAVRLVWGAGVATPRGRATAADQTLTFRTRAEFSARFSCARVNPRADCLPGADMRLEFTAPVPRAALAAIVLESSDGVRAPAVLDDGDAVDRLRFKAPFAPQASFKVLLPPGLEDDAGRPLANAATFPLEVATDDFPPLAKFSGEFGVLESREDGVLPVALRRIEADAAAYRLPAAGPIPGRKVRIDEDAEIVIWLERVRNAMARRGDWVPDAAGEVRWQEQTGAESVLAEAANAERFTLPTAPGAEAGDFQVVGIPLGPSGFYVVELASPRLGAALLGAGAGPRYVATTALVTNLAVHFQWGRESSLVWVTALDDGRSISRADVRVSNYCTGELLWRGVTDAQGVARIDAASGESPLPTPHPQGGCARYQPAPLFVSARSDGELGFALSDWTQGISPSSFGLPMGSWRGPDLVHTVLDRTLLRAGETVSMKHVVRRHTGSGFTVPQGFTRATLILRHDGSGERYESALVFDASGVATSTWEIPVDARLGRYQVEIRAGEGSKARSFWPGDFRVEAFRVPTMRAVLQPSGEPLVAVSEATVDVFLEYLSGGPAAGAAVRLRSLVEPRRVVHTKYEEFEFGGEDVTPGSREEHAGDYFFPEEPPAAALPPARVVPVTLDGSGTARITIPDLPEVTQPQALAVELEYMDANGEVATVARRLPLHPAALELGIRTEGWVGSAKQLRFQVLALALDGAPLPRQPVDVALFSRKTFSYRKRLVGGFYAYENRTVTEALDVRCEGRTDAAGLLTCEVEPGVAGEIVLRAVARDAAGHRALATRSMWLAGDEDWWFAGSDGDRMDVLPESPAYDAGQVARLQVRMPFRSATALVTVAREGVLDHFVTELSGREPVIEVPIAARYAPNVYVSVLAVRGRVGTLRTWLADRVRAWDLPFQVEGGSATAQVDLSKPAFRLGIAQLDVGFAPHRLDVTVTPAAPVYAPRETAKVRIAVARADGGALPHDAEVAFAAVDEGLLELAPNPSVALLEAMMNRRGIEVVTSTAQMQVVGKRHYGRKAVPQGGGGGQQGARELFDTLLLWRARIPLDAAGRAEVDVPLVDALTAYRLVAIAQAGTGHFGSGRAEIRTSQDVMLHAGLPPLVRQGDRFDATFTVRNASDRSIDVTLGGQVDDGATTRTLETRALSLAPGEARAVAWPMTVAAVDELRWSVDATAGDSLLDRLRVRQAVAPAVPVRVLQATLTQVGADPHVIAIERPEGALPGGGVNVRFARRLAAALDGVRRHMESYPYACLEQRISQAVVLDDEAHWRALMDRLPAYLDRDGLLRFFPAEWLRGDDVLTAYVLALAFDAGREIGESERERMLGGLTGFVEGRIDRRSAIDAADLTVRRLAALAALARYGRAQARHVGSFAVEPMLWPTSALLDWRELLERVEGIADGERRRLEADRLLRARLDLSGTQLSFAGEDAPWWLLVSGDVNAARLLGGAVRWPSWRADAPRLAQGVLGRLDGGHWDTTPANAWGMVAFDAFSSRFEAADVAGASRVRLAGETRDVDWSGADPPVVASPWPPGPAELVLAHRGVGRPWAFVSATAAIPLEAPLFAGYRVERQLTAVEQRIPGRWSRGDVAEVRIAVDAAAEMTWVVVDDPVPGGASILGSGLGRDSALLGVTADDRGDAWPAWVERRRDAYRAYYRYLPQGRVELAYRIRFDTPGQYALPPTRVEAMYAPERFGALPNSPIAIEGAP